MSKNYMYKLKEFEQHKNIYRVSESLYNDEVAFLFFFFFFQIMFNIQG